MEIDIFGVPVDLGADRRGVEMVEVNPILDVQNQTAHLAAEIILSALGRRVWGDSAHDRGVDPLGDRSFLPIPLNRTTIKACQFPTDPSWSLKTSPMF